MNDDRLAHIERNQDDLSQQFKTHQLNDSLEFSKAAETRARIEEKLEGLATKEDMQKLQPILEALAGGKIAITWGRVIYKVVIWLGAGAAAVFAIKRLW